MVILLYSLILLWLVLMILFYFFIIGSIDTINPDYVVSLITGLFLIDMALTIFTVRKYYRMHHIITNDKIAKIPANSQEYTL